MRYKVRTPYTNECDYIDKMKGDRKMLKIEISNEELDSVKLEANRHGFVIKEEKKDDEKTILSLKPTTIGANWCVFNAMDGVKVIEEP